MTRKDYVLLADALKRTRDSLGVAYTDSDLRGVALSACDSVAIAIGNSLAHDNSAFQFTRFLTAAGANEPAE